MQFTRHDDGTVTVDQFDDYLPTTLDLLAEADRQYLAVDWEAERVTILGVRYRIAAIDHVTRTATLTKES